MNFADKQGYDFRGRDESQKVYFDRFCKWLETQSHIKEVIPASEHEDRKLGIDVKALTHNNGIKNFQVKTDLNAYKTHNIVFEIISQAYLDINKQSQIGWGFLLQNTDYVVHIIIDKDKDADYTLGFKTKTYYEWIIKNAGNFQTHCMAAKNVNKQTNEIKYVTLGILVPIYKIYKIKLWKSLLPC